MSAVRKPVEQAVEFADVAPAEHQSRLIETLEIVTSWKEELQRRQQRMLLREELIGIDPEEIDQLKAEFDELARCMRVLSWRGAP